MEEREVINRIRALHFIVGVLVNQQKDPRCAVCKSRVKVVEDVKEEFEKLEGLFTQTNAPNLFENLYTKTKELFSEIKVPEKPIPQRKEGNCFFADQECLVKESFDVYEELLGED